MLTGDHSRLELRASSEHESAGVLSARFAADGYLLFRSLVDSSAVEELARSITAILRDQGLLHADADALSTFRATRTSYYHAVQRVEAFHALAHNHSLLRVIRALLGDDVLVHPRKLLRALWPSVPELTTPPHQDFPYIGGTQSTVTAWIPLTACRSGHGALRILAGSHREGIRKTVPSDTFAGSKIAVDDNDRKWASTDFERGDVLFFGSTTIHAATSNDAEGVRLSADYRYQPIAEPVAAAELKPSGYPKVPDWPRLLADVDWPYRRWIDVPDDIDLTEPSRPEAAGSIRKAPLYP